MIKFVTHTQAQKFLESLYPCGEMTHLSNHTRSFFEGLIGEVPRGLRYNNFSHADITNAENMAFALRELANRIEEGFVKNG
jgi:hypothetical protein